MLPLWMEIYDHYEKFRLMIDELLKKANLEVKFPFFQIQHAKKKKMVYKDVRRAMLN